MGARIYLVGDVAIESEHGHVSARALPGRLGRLLFVRLAADVRPVAVDDLATVLWGEAVPAARDASLRALLSNLRVALGYAGFGRDVIEQAQGYVSLHLPLDTWVDLREIANCVDRAEGELRAGRPQAAFGWAAGANAIALRPFLPGEEGAWVESVRLRLQRLRLRALDCLGDVFIDKGQWSVAVKIAEDALAVEPMHEQACRLLMRAHAAAGNRAEALVAYHGWRERLAEELGVSPSPETERVFRDVLATG